MKIDVKPMISLNLIMKNEAKVLNRMLESVAPIVDYYVVIDTGSTDNSKEIVRNFFAERGIDGEIHDHPFVDFEDARNYALKKLKGKAEFGFWTDCDEQVVLLDGFDVVKLKEQLSKHDLVTTTVNSGGAKFGRRNFFRASKPFRWQGKVHEILLCDDQKIKVGSYDKLEILVSHDGNSWSEGVKEKYLKHAEILEKEVKKTNQERDVFYLAQSYRDAGEHEKSIYWYKKRAEMTKGFWEERYYSQFMVGLMTSYKGNLGDTLVEYLKCSELDSERCEHILNSILLLQQNNLWQTAYLLGKYAVPKFHKKMPKNRLLFLNSATYDSKIFAAHQLTLNRLGIKEGEEQYHFTNNWFDAQKPVIQKLLSKFDKSKSVKILEIGSHEGRSTTHYIDNYLHHPESAIVSVDPYSTEDSTSPLTNSTKAIFEKNISLSKYPEKARLIVGYSQPVLSAMITNGEKFDYIVVDGSHLSKDVLIDACLSFQLLKDGGIMLFDDYLGGDESRETNTHWPKVGIDSFLKSYEGNYTIEHSGYHLAIMKGRPEAVVKSPVLKINKAADVIQSLINKHGYKSYLEVGVQKGITFRSIQCDKKVGVDPDPNSAATVYLPSDDFFKENKEKFDICFCDGLHHADQCERDILNMLDILNEGGAIVVHDNLPVNKRMQEIPLSDDHKEWTGNVWRAWVKLRATRPDLQMHCINIDWGTSVIIKGKQETIKIDKPLEELTYEDFVQNKKEWMNIISADEFTSIYIGEQAKPDRKVYDAFLFFNELDMLKTRLEELKDVVDTFVLVESRFTFSGQPKDLYFDLNKDKFKDYNIVHLIAEDSKNTDAWFNEAFQRNFASDYLKKNMKPVDIALLCDLDEIPNPEVIQKAKDSDIALPAYLSMDFYYYNFNWIKKVKWERASMVGLEQINNYQVEQIRSRKANVQNTIQGAGWHLSYFMSPVLIQEKIKSFSHQEFNKEEYLDLDNIKKAIDSGKDLFGRGEVENLIPRTSQPLPKNTDLITDISPVKCPEVDVCIISYAKNEELRRVTEKGIESLLASDDNVKFNVFVVESNKDVSYDKYPNTKTIYTKKPFGYHRYLNLARKEGKAPYVVLCNNDLTYEKNWASEIIKVMYIDDAIMSASPLCPQIQNVNDFRQYLIWYGHNVRKELAGWCIFQKREIYNVIGDLDERFEFWYCDNDYSMTLKKHNVKHALVSTSVVNHHENEVGKTGETLTNDEKQKATHGQFEIFKEKWELKKIEVKQTAET